MDNNLTETCIRAPKEELKLEALIQYCSSAVKTEEDNKQKKMIQYYASFTSRKVV